MEAVYPIGPVVDGVALNITVQSYVDSLFVGLNACPAVVPDVDWLARSVVLRTRPLGRGRRREGRAAPKESSSKPPPRWRGRPARRPGPSSPRWGPGISRATRSDPRRPRPSRQRLAPHRHGRQPSFCSVRLAVLADEAAEGRHGRRRGLISTSLSGSPLGLIRIFAGLGPGRYQVSSDG